MNKSVVFHARRFEHAVEPTKPIEGIVRDKDSGQPIAGLTLHAAVFDASTASSQPKASRRRPTPRVAIASPACPRRPPIGCSSSRARVSLTPQRTFRAPAESPAFEPVTFDIALKRGVLIRGRVTDKATGQPVPGYINPFTFRDNPSIKDFPGLRPERPGPCLHQGRRPVRSRRPAGPQYHRLPLRDAPVPRPRRRRGDQGI